VIGAAVGIRYLRQVAKGTIVPDKDRIRAAEFLIKRQYGTALIAIELPAEPVDLPHGLITKAALIEASGAPVYQPVDQDDCNVFVRLFTPHGFGVSLAAPFTKGAAMPDDLKCDNWECELAVEYTSPDGKWHLCETHYRMRAQENDGWSHDNG
jgi:hypothetical protein